MAFVLFSQRIISNFITMKTEAVIEIVGATSQDLPIIRLLAHQTFFATYLPIQPKDKVDYLFGLMYSTSSLTEQMENGQQFLLAKDETGCLGYASYEINYNDITVTKIHKIYVLPAAQGKGVGKKLMDAIASIARKNENQILSLQVFRKNPAIDFYEKIGFKKMEEINIDVGNGFAMNDFVMEKSL
jgi:diamine N-acetyltransferase